MRSFGLGVADGVLVAQVANYLASAVPASAQRMNMTTSSDQSSGRPIF